MSRCDDNIIKEAAEALNVPFADASRNCKPADKCPQGCWYFWDSRRGGRHLIIGRGRGRLVAGSAVPYDELASQFNAGRRS